VVALLRVGDLVSVVAADESGSPVVVARRVRVAVLPRSQESGVLGAGGEDSSTMVVVEVPTQDAPEVAVWAAHPALSVTLG